MSEEQPIIRGPTIDRFLMRIKDLIIIGTAIFALIRWAYQQKADLAHRLDLFETRLSNIERYMSLPGHRQP